MDLINLKNRSYPWDVRHTRWEQSRGGFELKKVLLDIRHMTFETPHSEHHSENNFEGSFGKSFGGQLISQCKYLSFG